MTTTNTLREIVEQPDLGITLSDGARLSVRAWIPEDAADDPVPVILEYLPYRKRDGTCARDALTHPYFAKRGYACLRVDMRGNGDSDGLMEDEYTEQELADAEEVIAWAAAQPWCNGSVGMMGISWGGFNSLQVAARQPDALKAIITLCSTVDRFADDIHYKGGCLLNENLGWGATMWSYSSRPPDPALRNDWREMWLERLEAEPFLPAVWLQHQRRDAYWEHGSVCEDFSAIKAKVLAIGGWGDSYKNAVPQIVDNVPGSKGIVGPWVHKYPHFAVPEPRIGFLQEALRWWDRWLKGVETGVEDDPDYRAYIMDGVRPATWYTERPGRWISQDAGTCHTDPAGTESAIRFQLGDDGLGATPATQPRLISSPADTGMDSGEYCAIWLGPEMAGDQRADDGKSVCWTSAPLAEDIDILGRPTLRLTLSNNHPQGQISVRLNHIHADGASTRVTYGVLNLSHRDGSATPEAMATDTPTEIEISLDHIGYRVPAGDRLRVSISNAYWPLIWPSPQANDIMLHCGDIALPVAQDTGAPVAFLPPEAEEPWAIEEVRSDSHVRKTEIDHRTGVVKLTIEDDFGAVRDLDHGLINGSIAREIWSIHPDDPLSANGYCHWTDETIRDGTAMRTEAICEMSSNATHFLVSATISAYENEKRIFHKEMQDSIPRDNL